MNTAGLSRMEVVEGDITAETTDAIVNAANETLLGGGGVDGAIHRAAGPGLLEACRELDGCLPGQAKVTGGFELAARWVVHTVGPIYDALSPEDADRLLGAAYVNALLAAAEAGARSVSFPAISTGAYGFPQDRAARVAVLSVARALEMDDRIELVRFVCFSPEQAQLHQAAMDALRKL
ncbi:O-acetyl-ADP-ribose deacetylase [Roseospira marina]|uniref:O-acetyl-ADP-ribose deacetylase n=1 Tax=Roseospira marina TaxID=140057 RepID=A0A5M6IDQ0_9PROT|nr:O-acetyl-ADP-ribose deacetylase [Roseospira marina]KAA5606192.1 O-acetyl-ADP-ribose deacetylase [Roseospira marina]MBB4314337.1 O-acetyl-ADP-ribose deacetylase (regulator of RNase III) [Roseospira marina]MBB5087497.1 O-acetyl-ADP-ribose deacetylase (regulator of RNase III) [Roseospira marina]